MEIMNTPTATMKTTLRTLCLTLAIATAPAFAGHGRHDGHYGYYGPPRHHAPHYKHHHGPRWGAPAAALAITGVAAGIAAATWYAAPRPVYVPPPPVYAPPRPAYAVPADGYWNFCASAGQYYPYVRYCPEGWQPVYP